MASRSQTISRSMILRIPSRAVETRDWLVSTSMQLAAGKTGGNSGHVEGCHGMPLNKIRDPSWTETRSLSQPLSNNYTI